MKKNKGTGINMFLILIFSLLAVAMWFMVSRISDKIGVGVNREEELDTFVYAKVTKVTSSQIRNENQKDISFLAVTIGAKSSKEITAHQIINDPSSEAQLVKEGDKVVLMPQDDTYIFQYYYRFDKVMYFLIAMLVCIILIGYKQGLKTIIALALTCISIFSIFIPAVKKGLNIYFSTVVICIYIIFETLLIVYGLNKKSFVAAVGCSIGVLFAGGISVAINSWLKMTGYLNDNSYNLATALGFNVDLKAIMFSMITIGALGAIMDVSMSITSPMYETYKSNRRMSKPQLIHFGMSIGKDFIGTMTNTLILAYIGSSMVVVLMYASSKYPLISIMNKEEIVFEFLQSIIGSMGILLTVPVTTIICANSLKKQTVESQRLPSHRNTF